MTPGGESREEVEMRLRHRLSEAENRLTLAIANSQRVLEEQRENAVAALEASCVIRNARMEESTARAEYMRILAEFTEFTLRGKAYEDEFLA